MRYLYLSCLYSLSILIFNQVNAQTATWAWAQSFATNGGCYTKGNALDAAGNSYLFWYDSTHISLVKASPAGQTIWTVNIPATDHVATSRIAVDSGGNLSVTGEFKNTLQFGSTTLISHGSTDVFVARFDASGNVLWARSFGDYITDTGYGVAVDDSGNTYACGQFNGTVNFDGILLSASGHSDNYLAKFDSQGNVLWARTEGYAAIEHGLDLCLDNLDHIYLTGYRESASGTDQFFVSKFHTSGVKFWTNAGVSSGGESRAAGIQADASGNCYITGWFTLDLTFQGVNLYSTGQKDIFVAKLNPAGGLVWMNKAGSNLDDEGSDIGIDSTGNVYVAANIGNPITFAGTLLLASAVEVMIGRYDSQGIENYGIEIDGSGNDYVTSLAIDPTGRSLISGRFNAPPNVGGNIPGDAISFPPYTLGPELSQRLFLARLGTVTGLSENETAGTGISLYPNPFQQTLMYHLSEIPAAPIRFTLTDVIGRTLWQGIHTYPSGSIQLNKELPGGIYFLELQVSEKTRRFKLRKE